MATYKSSKQDKEWFAERCGELLVKDFKHKFSEVVNEVMLSNPGVPRKEIESAYRTANPNNKQYAARTYNPYYERGAKKNDKGSNTTENNRKLGYLEIDRQAKLQQVREAISNSFIEGPISVVDEKGQISTINPKLLDIFDKNHELLENGNKNRSDGRDEDGELVEFDSAVERARQNAGSNDGQGG